MWLVFQKKTKLKKVAQITFTEDYDGNGLSAWLIQESYNGKISNPYSHKILSREYFNQLQEVISNYLLKGFDVEIKNQ